MACSGLREGLRKVTKRGAGLWNGELKASEATGVVQGQRVLRADKRGSSAVFLALGSWESHLCSLSLWPQFPQQEL